MKKARNTNLSRARARKCDEFYTRLDDIEAELDYYTKKLHDKVIYCNCDNPYTSNFYVYFRDNFQKLGLKKLYATNIKNEYNEAAYLATVTIDSETVEILDGDGAYRSDECTAILQDSDIVVTNPPFSLFRDFVDFLHTHKKDYIILGNLSAITYADFFPLLWSGEVRVGVTKRGGSTFFSTPNEKNGVQVNSIRWYTTLDVPTPKPLPTLTHTYTPTEYPTYDNYPAIEVGRIRDIPIDYDGVMGVPITYMDYHAPETYTIVGHRYGNDGNDLIYTLNDKTIYPYCRILIRPKPTSITI